MRKNKRKFLLSFALAGLILSSSIPLASKIEFKRANAEVAFEPISDYYFNAGNPGYDSKQHYSLTSQGNPVGAGTNSSHGTVTFDGSDDLLTTNGTSITSSNNLFYDYATSNLTVAFDFTVKSFSSDWMFPMTFFDGGDIWKFAKGHAGFLIDPDAHMLRYADTTGTTGLTDWWYPDIYQLSANTTITVIVTINKGGNTCIYINGNSTPVYNKASFSSYNASGSDWSGFTLGAFAWRQGSFAMGSGGYGFTNCSFQNLKIYNFTFTQSQISEWAENKDIYKTSYSISYETNGGTINSGEIDSYVAGEQYYLPTDVTKTGYVFGGWYDNSLFNGNPITIITKNDEGNKQYYAKWTAAETGDGTLSPDYYYLFTDSTNPGKESNSKASLKTTGTVSVSDGRAVFNGTGALYASGESGYLNFSNTLSSFTMGFNLTVTSTSSGWQFPLSFDFNDNTWLNFQIAPNSTKLMLSCSGAKQGDQTNVYWGHTVANNLNLNQEYRVTLSFAPGGSVRVYLNGSLALSTAVDSSFSTAGKNFTFAVGANYNASYSTLQNGFFGKIGKFDVYTFAANEKESIQDGVYKSIYYNNYSITLNPNGGSTTPGYTLPTTYKTRVGVNLPNSSQITREGYTFKGWFTNPNFTGEAVSSVTKNDVGNKVYYAKWVDNSISTDPIAYYEFKNSTNHGLDSAGSFNMVGVNTSVNNGVLSVTGNGALYGYGNGHNFMTDYTNFTLSFDANFHDLGSSEWKIPFSFGNNGTQAGCFNFNPSDPHDLRFKLRDGDTYIAGSGTDMLWGSKLAYLPEWTWINFTITVTAATSTTKGVIRIYVDGMMVLSKSLPIGYKMPINYLSFGGYYNGSSVSNGVNADFRNIRAYEFAATENQVNYFINNGFDLPGENTLPIHYDVGEHGYIIAPTVALKNELVTIQAVPSEDYIVDTVLVNDEPVAPISTNTYRVQIAKESNVSVTFIKNVFTMTSSTFGSGTVRFESGGVEVSKVTKGQPLTITVTPQEGYQTIGFRVNGVTKTLVDGKYEIASVDEDINVVASFEEIKPEHTVTFIKNGGIWVDSGATDQIVFTETVGCSLPGGVDITRLGYTFSGWWLDEECEVNHIVSVDENVTTDLTLYAKWEAIDYSITYLNLDGAVILDENYATGYKYGEGATLPVNVHKDGCNFLGWYDNPSYEGDPVTTIASDEHGDKMFYARLEKATYSITLHTDDGVYEGGYTSPTSYLYGTETLLPNENNIHKTGYTFAGWYDNPSFLGDAILSIEPTDYGNKEYYIKWENAQYDINYVIDGGSFVIEPDYFYTYGSVYTLPVASNINKTGYTFVGWYLDPYFESEIITKIDAGTIGAQTYYAKYQANQYDVTYLDKSGEPFEGEHGVGYVEHYYYDQNAILDNPTRDGYEFDGYYLNPECTPESLVTTLYKETYTENITLYVNWIISGENKIYYYLNGAEWAKNTFPTSYNVGNTIPLPDNTYLSRNGYSFQGWFDNALFEGEPIEAISSSETGIKTYYAKWEKLNYTISYYDGDVVAHEPGQYSIGNHIDLPKINKEGYTFVSWCSDSTLLNEVNYINADDYGDKVFYAKWEEINNIYNIIFDSNNGSGNTNNVAVMIDVDVNLNNYIYTKDNYHQVGWVDVNNNQYSLTVYQNLAIKGDTIVLFAVYKANDYSISYETYGGTINSGIVNQYSYGKEVTLPTDVTKDGYVFDGWYLADEFESDRYYVIPAGSNTNIALAARWVEKTGSTTFTVTLNLNGGKVLEGNIFYYEEGVATTLPTNVYLKGYKFQGWYVDGDYKGSPIKIIEASEKGDKEYFAKWEPDTYKVTIANIENGVVTVSSSLSNYNSQINITYTANYGYELFSISVNGEVIEPDSNDTYSFLLTSDSYVEAVFSKISFVVNIEEVEHGLVETEYDAVSYGEVIEFTFTPSKGYVVSSVIINGEDVTKLVVNNVLRYRADVINEEELDSIRKQLTITAEFSKEGSGSSGCQGDISSSIYIVIPITIGLITLIIFQRKEYYKKSSKKDE